MGERFGGDPRPDVLYRVTNIALVQFAGNKEVSVNGSEIAAAERFGRGSRSHGFGPDRDVRNCTGTAVSTAPARVSLAGVQVWGLMVP